MGAAVIQLHHYVVAGGPSITTHAHLRADFLFEFVETSVDLLEVPVDPLDVLFIEMVVGGRDAYPHVPSLLWVGDDRMLSVQPIQESSRGLVGSEVRADVLSTG